MNRRPLDTPHHDASRLTADERAELLELQAALALNPAGPGLGRMNLLLAKATSPAWMATVQPTRANNHRPVADPVEHQRRQDKARDDRRAARRDTWDRDRDALDDHFLEQATSWMRRDRRRA